MVPKYRLRYPLTLLFMCMFFCFVSTLSVDEHSTASSSFGFKKFDKSCINLRSQIALYGDAKVPANKSYLQITQSWNYSSGFAMYNQPFNLFAGNNPRNKASFGTYFVFSLSQEHGKGMEFRIIRSGYNAMAFDWKSWDIFGRKNKDGIFSVEFDTKGDLMKKDHVGIFVGNVGSYKLKNVSDVKLVLNSGEKLQCWIDYEASSKRIEVRVSKWGEERPVSPVISCGIDLNDMFKKDKVFLGLSSANGGSAQVCRLYSWSFKLRQVPTWMHSGPLDLKAISKDAEPVVMHKRSECVLRVLTALIFGTGCGALGAFIVLCFWSVCNSKKPVAPEEFVVQPVVYDFDKVKVIIIDKCSDARK